MCAFLSKTRTNRRWTRYQLDAAVLPRWRLFVLCILSALSARTWRNVQQHCTDCCLRFTLRKTTEFLYSAFPKYNCKNAFLMFAVFVGLFSYNNQTINFLGVSSGVDEDRVVLFCGVIGPRFLPQSSIHGRPYFPSKCRQSITRVTCCVNAKRSLTLMKSSSAVFSGKLSVALPQCLALCYPSTVNLLAPELFF